MGKFSRLNDSPWWTSSDGVRSSTSSPSPGRVMPNTSCLSPDVERNFGGAERTGAECMVERLTPPRKGVDATDQFLQWQVLRGRDSQVERMSAGAVREVL